MEITVLTRGKCKLAATALAARLYTPKGKLRQYYENQVRNKRSARNSAIAIAYCNGKAVGACYLDKFGNIMAYVKPRYRRIGVGRKLVESVKLKSDQEEYNLTSYHGHDALGSSAFWDKMRVVNYLSQTSITEQEYESVKAGSMSFDEALRNAKRKSWLDLCERMNQAT